jgi:2-polyprenyl-6-methoxyphenol hydroxylase-like FAD-dependent oxidoreductase
MMAGAYRVLIVGAGPTGLSLAIELGSRGVSCLVVERNDRVGHAPRAKTTNVRTRTHLRRWGIADQLAAVSPFGVDYPSDVAFVTRLAGPALATIRNASSCAPARSPLYPEHGQWVPQYKLEEVLRGHAASLDAVEFHFSTELVGASQDEGHVSATLRDRHTGAERHVVADFLVGADGARSAARDLIGASMDGQYGLSRNYNIVFHAPGLSDAHRHGPASMYWQVNPDAPSLIGPMDRDDIWFFMPTRLKDGFAISDAEAADLIRQATGIDLDYTILSRDEWVASSLIADRYRAGRILLAGDACHLHPPFGGYGMNMGVSDAVDLGWKLAAVVQGWGGPALLDSYEAERRPVHQQVVAEAQANHAILSNDLWQDGLEDASPEAEAARAAIGRRIVAEKSREFHTLGTVLGLCYASSPIVVADTGRVETAERGEQGYIASSGPGCLAPHAWRADGHSLYDLFGAGFTLLHRAGADMAAALVEADARGISITIVALEGDDEFELYPTQLTLIRPDQHVAWRGQQWRPGLLGEVTGWGLQAEAGEPAADGPQGRLAR